MTVVSMYVTMAAQWHGMGILAFDSKLIKFMFPLYSKGQYIFNNGVTISPEAKETVIKDQSGQSQSDKTESNQWQEG